MEETWELAALDMEFSAEGVEKRKPIWDAMQMVWMDTDVSHELPNIISICAESNFDISKLEMIYWNEVRPVVAKNMMIPIAPEWAGYDLDWLVEQIQKRLRSKKVYKKSRWRRYFYGYWEKIEEGILRHRSCKL